MSTEPKKNSDPIAEFARGLVDLRRSVRLTVDDLATRTGLPKAAITLATDGATLPDAEVVEAYVRRCGGSQQDVERWLARREKLAPPPVQNTPPPVEKPPPPPPPGTRPGWLPRHAKKLTLAAALVILAGLVIVWSPWTGGADKFTSVLPACAGPAQATLRIASSADKDVLLRNAAHDYGPHLSNGQCVDVVVDTQNSGIAMSELAKNWPGPSRPDVWSPASSLWIPLARARGTKLLPETPTGQFVTSPLVIAMPKPMAEALGWPNDKNIGWKRLADLAVNPRGWADLGHPKWGQFWLGKTNPTLSSSGFNATVAAFFAKQHKVNDLTRNDILDKDAQDFVKNIEKSVAHYGETTLDFLTNLRRADDQDRDAAGKCTDSHEHALTYISAVTVEESSMLAYNDGWPTGTASGQKLSKPCTKLVAIYPSEGTLYSDQPYIELTGMDATKQPVSTDFLNYLRSNKVQEQFQALGFRDRTAAPSGLVTQDNGALPDRNIVPLGMPDGSVLDAVLTEWSSKLRKPADILLVIDTSGSMGKPTADGTRLALVQKTVPKFLTGLAETDRVGLWAFSDAYTSLVPVGPLSNQRQALTDKIAGLKADGGTALYDTVAAAVDQFSPESNANNAIVLLTDGKNEKTGGLALGDEHSGLLGKLQPNSDRVPVRVFTIAYGTEADEKGDNGKPGSVLEQISGATGATRYESTDTANIEKVLAAVFSNF